jgi:hypothetical protein
MIACDFFTVETILLRRFYVLFFIAHANRRVWLAGCTRNPTGEWVTQQARNLGLDFSESDVRFLIRDRDSKDSGLWVPTIGVVLELICESSSLCGGEDRLRVQAAAGVGASGFDRRRARDRSRSR